MIQRYEYECSEGHGFTDPAPFRLDCPVIVGRTPAGRGQGPGREIPCPGETRRIGTGSRAANVQLAELRSSVLSSGPA